MSFWRTFVAFLLHRINTGRAQKTHNRSLPPSYPPGCPLNPHGIGTPVGTVKPNRGHCCEDHSCCSEVLEQDVFVCLRGEQILVPNKLSRGYCEETAYTVNWVTDGQDCCRIGFLPRALVAKGGLFDGVLCQILSVGDAFDNNKNKRAKVKHNCGYARAQVISPLNEAG